ncbi:MAG: acetylornithine carbamoyltransferase [Chitinophagaceae bacterium]|nr:acetylornithine carbamoyltransferase [Chitinophagaceae bacterium]
MRHFLSVADAGDINNLVEDALRLKARPDLNRRFAGKRLGLIFMNPSLRTRVSTQVAALNLGLDSIVLNTSGDSWQLEFAEGAVMDGNTVEHVKDAAPVLGSYFDILGIRTFPGLKNKEDDYAEKVLNAFVKYAGVPVMSLESATRHPLQSLADIITITEYALLQKIKRPKVVLMWAPHVKPLPQCVANSFSEWMNAWGGADFLIAHPEGYELDRAFTGEAKVIYIQEEALQDADFVYVKNWSSVSEYGKILPVEGNWMLTNEKLESAPEARIMHCLPVRRNLVLSDEILDSERSIVTAQAGNRVWSAQAVLSEILEDNF